MLSKRPIREPPCSLIRCCTSRDSAKPAIKAPTTRFTPRNSPTSTVAKITSSRIVISISSPGLQIFSSLRPRWYTTNTAAAR